MALAFIAPARGELLINEFLPDPEGSDAGREFVELFNNGPVALDLLGVCLDFGNGAQQNDWSVRWECGETLLLPAGGRLLLVDRNWQGEAHPDQVEVYLGLQNGPDAIRLRRGEQVLDLVGYGALTDTLMMETAPARSQPGRSLARRPDGRDTQDNSRDFVSAEPTPGTANFSPHALSVLEYRCEPAAASLPGVEVVLAVHLENTGTEVLPAGPLELLGPEPPVTAHLDLEAPAADSWVLFRWQPWREGCLELGLRHPVSGTADTLRLPLGSYQVGPAGLVLNEVLSEPGDGQGEWVEVLCGGTEGVDLEHYLLRDEDGQWVPFPPGQLLPGERLVLAQDPEALLDWQAQNQASGGTGECLQVDLAACLARPDGGWPTLNNTPPGDRDFADRVWLARLAGEQFVVIDQVVLGAAGGPGGASQGRSWERLAWRPINPLAANWSGSTAPAGSTPGCVNSVAALSAPTTELTLEPEVLGGESGRTTQHVRFQVPTGCRGWTLSVYDSWGHRVRDLGGDLAGPGPRDLIWDGRDESGQAVPSGLYVVLVVLLGPDSQAMARLEAVSAVHRGMP